MRLPIFLKGPIVAKFISSQIPAYMLMEQDRFKMGGQIYRVQYAGTTAVRGEMRIIAYPIFAVSPMPLVMTVMGTTMFKVYNKKPKKNKK
jgi:hypothetical protein